MNKKVYIRQDGTIPGHRIIEELERRGAKGLGWNYEDIDAVFFIDEESWVNFQGEECLDNYTELLYNKETDSFYENTGNDSQRMKAGEAKEALLSDTDKKIPIELQEWKFDMIDGTLNALWTIQEGYEATIEDGKVIVRKKWNISMAKAGDVLADNSLPFIYKSNVDNITDAYCGINLYGEFQVKASTRDGSWTWMTDIRPATQKEKDLLFRKMDEAGYEWDAEKLELRKKKWQPKDGEPVWSAVFYRATMTFGADFFIVNCDGYIPRAYEYQTEEEAQAFCDKLNNAIKPILEERRKEVEG